MNRNFLFQNIWEQNENDSLLKKLFPIELKLMPVSKDNVSFINVKKYLWTFVDKLVKIWGSVEWVVAVQVKRNFGNYAYWFALEFFPK